MTEVQRSRIRAVAAHLWQTQERFDITDGRVCIIAHAVHLPEMNLAGLKPKMMRMDPYDNCNCHLCRERARQVQIAMLLHDQVVGFQDIAYWFGLPADFFALEIVVVNGVPDISRTPWGGCQYDARGAAIMLLTAIGEMGPPERKLPRQLPVVVAQREEALA